MKKNSKKQHPTELRDREEDLKILADLFFSNLTLVSSRRHPVGLWGLDPREFPLVVDDAELSKEKAFATEVLQSINYKGAPCETCGSTESSKLDEVAIGYANELWSDLGSYLERRWNELHLIEAEHQNEKEEAETCSANNCCGGGCHTSKEDEEVSVCDYCSGDFMEDEVHVCTCPDCCEEYDSNDECGCESEEE